MKSEMLNCLFDYLIKFRLFYLEIFSANNTFLMYYIIVSFEMCFLEDKKCIKI